MRNTPSSINKIKNKNLVIWVLAPHMETTDENLEYYYDFTQSIEEYTGVFNALQVAWKWQPVTTFSFEKIISRIEAESYPNTPLVFNLCDGDGIHDIPGISVIRQLEKCGLMYTGADEFFYDITTSKIPMKRMFETYGVPTPKWKVIDSTNNQREGILADFNLPVIVKPAVSGGSMGVGLSSVVDNVHALAEQVKVLEQGYHGWDLTSGGIIMEEFIDGPEFTVLIVGSWRQPEACTIYEPVERVFHPSLPAQEKFLSFDRLWEMYEKENALEENQDFYNYHHPDSRLVQEIKKISMEAYCAVKGESYARIDIRMDQQTGKMYVLEVNAQCGLSEDENFTSIGAILRLSGRSFSSLIHDIIQRVVKQHTIKVAV